MRKFILAALLLMGTGVAAAQPFKLGAKIGFTALSTGLRDGVNSLGRLDSRDIGFTAGIVGRIGVPVTGLYVQPELVYNHAKYKINDRNDEGWKLAYNNLEFPVMVGFKFLIVNLQAGPVFNIKTFDKNNNRYDIERPNVGYAAGGGIEIGKVSINVRYQGYLAKKVKSINVTDLNPKDRIKVTNGFTAFTVGTYF